MNEQKASVEVLPEPTTAAVELPPGVQPSRNYLAAVELGHVLAKSGYYRDARDPAKAAVKVMIGMDLGFSPTAALQAIHWFEDKEGRTNFLIEGKLLAALIKMRPGYEYRYVERTDKRVEIEFSREGKVCEPNIVWDLPRAEKAGLLGKKNDMYAKFPAEMMTWRGIAEGTRAHFPELLAGQPIYAFEEFGEDAEELKLREALEPAKAQPLTDEKAEVLRTRAREVKDEIDAINPEAVIPTRFAQAIAKAEHSHEQLENVVKGYEFLRDCEREFADLSEQLSAALPASEHKALVDRAKRRGSPQERVEVLRGALGKETSDG